MTNTITLTNEEIEVISDMLNATHTTTDDTTFKIRQQLRDMFNIVLEDNMKGYAPQDTLKDLTDTLKATPSHIEGRGNGSVNIKGAE